MIVWYYRPVHLGRALAREGQNQCVTAKMAMSRDWPVLGLQACAVYAEHAYRAVDKKAIDNEGCRQAVEYVLIEVQA